MIDTLRQHIFNWAIWPDFSALPSAECPFMRHQVISESEFVVLLARTRLDGTLDVIRRLDDASVLGAIADTTTD